jgi:hypothetical protein
VHHCGTIKSALILLMDGTNMKRIKHVGETRGPQEETTDERDTKKSSCNSVMGYDAKCKKYRV